MLKLSFDFAMVKEPNGAVLIDGKYYELQPTMNAGFIVLSYLIALVGSLCTLELLIRRTSNRGASNLVLLALAGICFGAVSTFAMHFVGNQSLALHFPDVPGFEGYKPLYLSYLGGLTVLSFVVSCLAMTFAFFVMGTDIKWRTLPCFGGRKNADDRGARDDYNRWKLQKSRLGKASVPSIFQQAGMGANWPNNQQQTRRGWKPWLFGDSSPDSPMTFAPDLDPDEDQDEDSLVKHDKELGEIDFRFGRMAVRDAIDRRQTARDGGSPMDSALQTPEASIVGVESPMTELPTSPLAAYYPTNGAREIAAPIDIRSPPSPNGVFTPGYQFPPRDAEPTASLIPRPRSGIIMGWTGPPAEALVPRRGSLPASVLPAVPQRLAQNTLSRIQSLPEHDNEPPIRRYSIDTKEEPHNSCSDETEDHHVRLGSVDPLPYEDEDDEQRTTLTGWRTRLRSKVQSGLPLTPLEKVVRFVGLDVVTSSDIIKISLTGMLAGWGVAAMRE